MAGLCEGGNEPSGSLKPFGPALRKEPRRPRPPPPPPPPTCHILPEHRKKEISTLQVSAGKCLMRQTGLVKWQLNIVLTVLPSPEI
ncbi:hypothetical protein ANN_16447 [Periplaneta americana]|uniref:Uncharacterized protein n=1 Tax=Periplaneta americana TaxID=6978 RepID=A0ABQ8SJ48_PERAM|nr:hypothetical protein ANN_16447 [Periplaneta americana]